MTDLLTEAEAQTLAAARAILRDLQGRAYTAGAKSDETNAEHNAGFVCGKCDAAREALTSTLIAVKAYGNSDNAAAVLS